MDGCIRSATEREASKDAESGEGVLARTAKKTTRDSGGDALMGHTRSHPEHEG